MKQLRLYVCTETHAGNFFITPSCASEQDQNGIQKTDAVCLICGNAAQLVSETDALLVLNAAELHVVDVVAESIERHRTEPLSLHVEEVLESC